MNTMDELVEYFFTEGEVVGPVSVGNLYVENNILYSYDRSKPIAMKIHCGEGYEVVINKEDMSPSSNRHREKVKDYVEDVIEVDLSTFKEKNVLVSSEGFIDDLKIQDVSILEEDRSMNSVIFQTGEGEVYISFEEEYNDVEESGIYGEEGVSKKFRLHQLSPCRYEDCLGIDEIMEDYLPREVVKARHEGKILYKVEDMYFIPVEDETGEIEENTGDKVEEFVEGYCATRVSEKDGRKYVKGVIRDTGNSKVGVRLYGGVHEERKWHLFIREVE